MTERGPLARRLPRPVRRVRRPDDTVEGRSRWRTMHGRRTATRAMVTYFSCTCPTPVNVLKKVRKNAIIAASMILDWMPIPNQTMKSGASAIRGMPYTARMYGFNTRASVRASAIANPNSSPSTLPKMYPTRAARNVNHASDTNMPFRT